MTAQRWNEQVRDERSITFTNTDLTLQITICAPEIVRIRYFKDIALPHRSWAVTPADSAWPVTDWQVTETQSVVRCATSALAVLFDRDSGLVQCATPDGTVFCADAVVPTLDGSGAQGAKAILPGEHFYGFGERTGPLEKTGLRYTNWSFDPENPHTMRVDEMYATFPVAMITGPGYAYGLLFNSTFRSTFDIGAADIERFALQTDGPELDYYIVFGPTPPQVTAGWRTLLGAMPLPPRWALGYHQSRWSYEREEQVRELAAEFRGRDIPCDVIHLDIDYMEGYRVFTWSSERFPDPERLIGDLAGAGFRIVTIIDPGVKVDPNYAVFAEGRDAGMFVKRADGSLFTGYVWPDESAFADYTRPEVREWWGDLHKGLLDAGVQGIWDDMNEPTVFNKPFSEGGGGAGTIDLDAPQGPADEQTTHAEVHNLYGLLMARSTYEGQLALRPERRPFVLTRSGFAGLQRWAALWTGDNTALWEHLEMTLPQLANLGLSGVPFAGVDIGGFFGDASPELWARWVQLGAFLPFARGHSCAGTRLAEPWAFGERTESIARAYLTLRYRLLPYLYTLFHEAATTGAPIIRPLLYHFPDDAATVHGRDQALCGPSLLLAPIVRAGVEHRAVYLPAGTWYDWWTGERMEGPLHLLAHAPLERLPLYVRGGSVVPMGPALQYTDERPLDELTLDIFPAAADGSFTLYEDDGESFGYERGEYATTTFTCVERDGEVLVTLGAREGAYVPHARTYTLNVRGPKPRSVVVDGVASDDWAYGEGATTLVIEDDGRRHEVALAW